MRWLYVMFVGLAYIASQASSQSSQVAGSGASKLSSETDDASDRSRRSLSDIAARRRSSLDKNFISCGRACSTARCSTASCDDELAAKRRSLLNKNVIRFGRSSSNFMRFGRSPSNFMRFGRSSNFMRFGRRGPGGAEEALEAMRALRCVDLLSALRGGRQALDKRAAALAANADRRNDNFMRLGRAARDAADYEADGSSERRARDAQQRSEDEVKADDGAKYLGDGFLRLGRDPEDNTSSAEDVFEIDLPDDRLY